MKIGIYYGSSTGNTSAAAEQIKAELDSLGEVSLNDISGSEVSDFQNYDMLVLGSSTWGLGELQDDWYGKESFDEIDISGKKVAVFGTGDQEGYADTFIDAVGIIALAVEKAGAVLLGNWPTDGYNFTSSLAAKDSHFLGLALDDDNQPDQTADRIKKWVKQLQDELGL